MSIVTTLLKDYRFELFFILLSIALRIPSLICEPPFWDETLSWVIAQNGYLEIFSATSRDTHPPFYYLVLKIWSSFFGDGIINLRLLSLLFWEVAYIGLMIMVRKLDISLNKRLVIYVLLAVIPVGIRLAALTRMYALDLALVVWALVAFYYFIEGGKVKFLIIYTVLILLALYTLNISLFVAAGVIIFFLLSKIVYIKKYKIPFSSFKFVWGQKAWLFMGSQILALILYMPWILVVMQQSAGPATKQLAWSPDLDLNSLLLIAGILLGIDDNNKWGSLVLLASEALVVFLVVFQLAFNKKKHFEKSNHLFTIKTKLMNLLTVITITTLVSLLLLFLVRPAIAPRSFILTTIFFLLVLAALIPLKPTKTNLVFTLAIYLPVVLSIFIGFALNYWEVQGEMGLREFFKVINEDHNTRIIITRQQQQYPIAYQQVRYFTRTEPKTIFLDAETDSGDYIIYDKKDFLDVNKLRGITDSFYYFNFLDNTSCLAKEITGFQRVYYSQFEEFGRKAEICKFIQLNPTYADTYFNRGLTYYELNQYEQAIRNHGNTLQLDSNDTLAYNNRGLIYVISIKSNGPSKTTTKFSNLPPIILLPTSIVDWLTMREIKLPLLIPFRSPPASQ